MTNRVRTTVGGLLGPLLKLRLLALRDPRNRGLRYTLAFLLGAILFFGSAAMVVKVKAPTYTSKWTIIIPGSGSGVSLFLQGIGQASSNSSSPYASISHSPRVNYKEIASSSTVLDLAAAQLDITPGDLGKPRIKLIQQSSLMSFSINGPTPESAQAKANAIMDSLQFTLDRLRKDELGLRKDGLNDALNSYSSQLAYTRKRLLDHQTESNIISEDQLKDLIANVDDFERQLIEVNAEAEQDQSYLRHLAGALNVTEEFAALAVVLHSDEVVARLIREYVDARAVLQGKQGSFGPNHPRMRSARATVKSIEADFRRRSMELLGRADIDVTRLVMLDVQDNTGALFRELVVTAARLDGSRARKAALESELAALKSRMQSQVGDAAVLADLERDHKIAEAVFSSAMAKGDTGKADSFVSYPLIQTIVQPTLPGGPDRRPAMFVLAGAAAASIAWLVGLALLWVRMPPCSTTPKN